MSLVQPGWLYALLPLLLLSLWLGGAEARRRSDLARMGDPALLAARALRLDARRRRRAQLLRLLALTAMVLALSRPQWGQRQEVFEPSGRQVMLVLDVSASMLAQDLAPNRLERAKIEIQALLSRMPGDQVGLVLFSGAAFTQVPLTVDHALLLNMLELAEPRVISRPGTVIGAAIDAAVDGFDPQRQASMAIVLLTDGEDPEPGAAEAAQGAADAGLVLHTIGFGSAQGAEVPELDAQGRIVGRQHDDSGEIVISRLDAERLRELTRIGGGEYLPAAGAGQAAAELAELLERLDRVVAAGELGNRKIERFQWLAVLALICWLGAELSPHWRRRRRVGPGAAPDSGRVDPEPTGAASWSARVKGLLVCGLVAGGASACGSNVHSINQDANRAFESEDWAAAAERYLEALEREPGRAELLFNLGNARYREQDVEAARQLLQQALEGAETLSAAEVWFNLGTLALNAGEPETAVEAYKAVLRAQPDHADAKHNLELALAAEAATTEHDETAEPGGTPSPQGGSPTPGGSATPEAGSGTPGPGGEEAGQTTPEAGQDASEGSPEPGSEAEDSQDGDRPEANAPLTPEQAERLLEALGQDTMTLQERLGQIYVVPGPPPRQRW